MRRILPRWLALFTLAAALTTFASAVEIKKVETPPALTPLPLHIGGRTVALAGDHAATTYRFQWPGVYFEAAFTGHDAFLQLAPGRAIYHVLIDDQPASDLVNPAAGVYRVQGLADGTHRVRVELATECQGGAVNFGGIAITADAKAAAMPARERQIEFIGDSHTVGYGDTSAKRQCTPDEIWATTDTTQAFGPQLAKHYQADYQINAISGRGIIRNYGGGGGDPLPQAYPFVLFDHQPPVETRGWNPQVVVVGLGTNDFSTPLKPDEKWNSRDALHADFERSYVHFIQQLRLTHPRAFFILAATDANDGEIQAEVRKVADQLISLGETRVALVPYGALELTACDWHPSLADHQKMAAILTSFIDSRSDIWSQP